MHVAGDESKASYEAGNEPGGAEILPFAGRPVLHAAEPEYIDLRPLLVRPAAAEVLQMAREQLNRAFLKHGLISPDPLPIGGRSAIGPNDDPTTREQFPEAYIAWASEMPLKLAVPVIKILRQTHEALCQQQDNVAGANAAREAYEFLLRCTLP